jgi:hypothetical protein
VAEGESLTVFAEKWGIAVFKGFLNQAEEHIYTSISNTSKIITANKERIKKSRTSRISLSFKIKNLPLASGQRRLPLKITKATRHRMAFIFRSKHKQKKPTPKPTKEKGFKAIKP